MSAQLFFNVLAVIGAMNTAVLLPWSIVADQRQRARRAARRSVPVSDETRQK